MYVYCTGSTAMLQSRTQQTTDVCAIRTLLGVDRKHLSLRRGAMHSRFIRNTEKMASCRVDNWSTGLFEHMYTVLCGVLQCFTMLVIIIEWLGVYCVVMSYGTAVNGNLSPCQCGVDNQPNTITLYCLWVCWKRWLFLRCLWSAGCFWY